VKAKLAKAKNLEPIITQAVHGDKKCRGLGLLENEIVCKLLGLCLGLQVRLKMFVTLKKNYFCCYDSLD